MQALQEDIDHYREKFLLGWNEIRELYDLSTDRGETHDLANENQEKLDELVQIWEAQREVIIQQITSDTIAK